MKFYDVDVTISVRARSMDEALRLVSVALSHGSSDITGYEFQDTTAEVSR